MSECYSEWTACEFQGHAYVDQHDGTGRCTDCGDEIENDDTDPARFAWTDGTDVAWDENTGPPAT